ncbi:MAG: hypothetical protein HON70_07615 [Lentisphaerae bacterium]|nr:hypothetical protein [Lentisphaerota bacterium]
MSPAHAARFVETLRSVPRSGNGTEALRQLSTMLEGRPGRILVLASRDRALWPVGDLSEETVEAQTPCHFCDLTSRRLPSFLRSAGPPTNGTPGTWLFRLGGSPKLLQGRRITVSSGDRVLVTGVVALAQAMARSLRLTPPADVPAGPCAATIEGDSKHPWLTRFFAPHSAALDPGHTLVVLRPETEGALLADKILSAALLAVRPDLRIQHSRPDQTNGLPQAGAATILVDPPALASSSLDWLKESAGRGHHVLLCYTHAPAAGSNSVIPGLSVARAVSTEESDEGALHLDGGGNVSQDLNELILGGLLGLPAEGMLSFDSDPPLIPILSTADGRPVIAQGRPPLPGTWLFLATPVDLAPEGPALHPLFPLLLRRMLWSGDSSSGNRGNVPDVNASVDLCGWLGVPRAQGELVAPDDSRSTWDCTAGDKAAFIPPLPGIYRFEDSAGLVTTHCVNPAVPPQTDDMERDAWEQQHATYKVNWSDDTPPPAEWLQGNDAGIIGETARRYDLSAIALALVLLACAVESAALLIVWRRPQPSSSAVHNFG